jgi:putative hydrolase of the HAD superfamily
LLIIFDLDDTLIDTSGCITHYKLEEALEAMVTAGLVLDDFSSALELLRRLDSTSESAGDALSEFLEILGAGKTIFEVGMHAIYNTPISELPIFPLEGVLETLSHLGQRHQLALVSRGKYSYQVEKLKKAGIDSHFFSKIVVTEEGDKKFHYQTIVEELGFSGAEVLVCGDRILPDLIPARELGYKTVQMQWGRGLNMSKFRGDVDYAISEITQLTDIINSLMTFSSF